MVYSSAKRKYVAFSNYVQYDATIIITSLGLYVLKSSN